MYRINPFQPISAIVNDLRGHEADRAGLALSRSAVFAVHEDDPEAMLRLALAFCAWRDLRPDQETVADLLGLVGTTW